MIYLIPLISALIYPIGSLYYKQAQQAGAGPWRATILSNWIMAACFLPLPLFQWDSPNWSLWMWPVLAGLLFFLGQLFTVLAVHAGDVSVQAPLMGTKTIFVALYSVFWLKSEQLGPALWLAVALTAVAVFLLGGTGTARWKDLRLAVVYALLSCVFFSGSDAIVGAKGQSAGPVFLMLTMMGSVALFSLLFWPLARREAPSPGAGRYVLFGGLAYGLQALVLGIGLSFYGRATMMNVVYASRGLFAIGLVWFLGHLFANRERQSAGRRVMVLRLIGALLLLAAIGLVFAE